MVLVMGIAVAFGGGDATAIMPSIASGKASVVPSELRLVAQIEELKVTPQRTLIHLLRQQV